MIKNMMKFLLAILVVALVFGCQKNEKGSKVYVGTNAEFAPFEYREGKNIVGFDIDLIKEIGRISGFEIEFVDMQFDGLLPALESGKIDLIISGMTATEDRKKFVDFSSPYYSTKQAILVYQDEQKIQSFDDLVGRKVGVVLGFTGDILVSRIPNIQSQKFNAASEVILALKSKKIEAVVMDYETAKNYAKQNSELKLVQTDFASEEYAIAMRKENEELLGKINQAIKQIKENGFYDGLIAKYFQ